MDNGHYSALLKVSIPEIFHDDWQGAPIIICMGTPPSSLLMNALILPFSESWSVI